MLKARCEYCGVPAWHVRHLNNRLTPLCGRCARQADQPPQPTNPTPTSQRKRPGPRPKQGEQIRQRIF